MADDSELDAQLAAMEQAVHQQEEEAKKRAEKLAKLEKLKEQLQANAAKKFEEEKTLSQPAIGLPTPASTGVVNKKRSASAATHGSAKKLKTTKSVPAGEKAKCRFCGKEMLACSIPRHENLHVSEEFRKKFTCNICDKSFTELGNLSKHKKKFHVAEHEKPRFPCVICDRTFNTKGGLKGHFETHKSVENRPVFQCEHCEYNCHYKHRLYAHIRGVHGIEIKCQSITRVSKAHLKKTAQASKTGNKNAATKNQVKDEEESDSDDE